ncbi:MAG: large conductance mechanosensitive channel protein MscL [Actinomycetota bacterium]
MLKEFKEFIDRGNVLDLAVAVVLGVAFAAVVNAFVDYVLLAIIGAIFGEPGFSFLDFELNDVIIGLGTFIGAVVQFLLIAFGVFMMVKAINAMKKPTEDAPASPSEIELLTEIRDALRQR